MTGRIWARVAGLALAMVLSGCSAAGFLNTVTSRSGYETVRDVRYAPGARGTLDLYVPAGATAETPLVVFVYGGSWDSGSKDLYRFVGQSLASDGFIVAVPDYRVYPEVIFPRFVEDGARAVAAVEKLARKGGEGIPAGRHKLALMGHSAGAEIAALLAFDARYLEAAGSSASHVSAFVGLAGPYDFLPLTEERYKRIFPPAVRAASQPVNFVSGNEAPALLVAGLDDTTVNPENTRSMARAIRAAGGRVEEMLLPDIDHIGAVSSLATALPLGDRSLRRTVLTFLEEHTR